MTLYGLYICFKKQKSSIPFFVAKNKESLQKIADKAQQLFPTAGFVIHQLNFEDGECSLLNPNELKTFV